MSSLRLATPPAAPIPLQPDRGCAIDDARVFARLRTTWQPVARADEVVSGRVLARRLLERDVVLTRLDDGPAAWSDGCPHRGARFALGWSDGASLVCPYHGWAFDRAGRCRSIPSLGGACAQADGVRIPVHACRERYGFIWVCLEPGAETPPLPEIPEFEDPAWTYLVAEPMAFAAGFRREVENYLDMSHFAFAHRETLGKAAAEAIDRYQLDEFEDGVRMRADFPALAGGGPLSKLQQAHRREQRAWWPNITTIRQSFPDGDARVLVHVPAPVTPTSCVVWWSIAISPGFRGPAPEEQMAFAVRVLDEDRRMCENQRPLEVPLTGEHARYVPADRFALTWRKGFASWVMR